MAIPRARTIDDLFAEVRDHPLVLTPLAPLASALNDRVPKARLGLLAATPKQLAGSDPALAEKRSLFHAAIDETDLGWRRATHLLSRAIECWEQTADLERFAGMPGHRSEAARAIVGVLQDHDSVWRRLAEGRVRDAVPEGAAVVGPGHLDALDREALPDDVRPVPLFADGTVDLPALDVFASKGDVVAAVGAVLTGASPEDVALVLSPTSEYKPLVESLLEAHGIPFQQERGLAGQAGVQAFLELTRRGLAGGPVRVQEVRPHLARFGARVPTRLDARHVRDTDRDALVDLVRYWDRLGEATFADAVGAFGELSGADLARLRDVLDELGIVDAPLAPGRVDDLAFYLEAFDVFLERDRRGVLLASPATGGWVDRATVLHLGVDASWTRRVPDRPWVDRARVRRRHLEEFAMLLQQGHRTRLLVQDVALDEPVTPCYYLHELLDVDFERFTDLPHTVRAPPAGPGTDPAEAFDHRPVEASVQPIVHWSASALSTYARCPREYYMDRVVSLPEQAHLEKGALLHQFAELYVARPDAVGPEEVDVVVDVALEHLAPFVDEADRELLATEVRLAVDSVMRFLDSDPPVRMVHDGYRDGPLSEEHPDRDNLFAEALGLEAASPIAEQSFQDDALGLQGTVDLIHGPDRLVDWKTGANPPTPAKVRERCTVDEVAEDPDFQAIAYLAHHRRVRPDTQLTFTFHHLLGDADDAVLGRPDPDAAACSIDLVPATFRAFLGTRDAYDAIHADLAERNPRRRVLEGIGYQAYRSFLADRDLPAPVDGQAWMRSGVADAFVAYAKRRLDADFKWVERGARQTLRELAGLRDAALFADDLEAFTTYARTRRAEANDLRAGQGRFPVREEALEEVQHRDLVLRDL